MTIVITKVNEKHEIFENEIRSNCKLLWLFISTFHKQFCSFFTISFSNVIWSGYHLKWRDKDVLKGKCKNWNTDMIIWLFQMPTTNPCIWIFIETEKINNIFIFIRTYMYLKEVNFFLEKNKSPATEMHVCCIKTQ